MTLTEHCQAMRERLEGFRREAHARVDARCVDAVQRVIQHAEVDASFDALRAEQEEALAELPALVRALEEKRLG